MIRSPTIRYWADVYWPYWLWRPTVIGLKEHMRINQPVRNLAIMSNAPDETLDQKGRWVKHLARELLAEEQGNQ